MADHACFIDGSWADGQGEVLTSIDPVDQSTVWSARSADAHDVADALAAARKSQPDWEAVPFDGRRTVLERFAVLAGEQRAEFASAISRETGKPLWEADTEVGAVIGKVALSIEAYLTQTPATILNETAGLHHRALGVMGVLGPFNFPAHLPNGQIVPALLAGNAVVYKPSEITPGVAALHVALLAEAGVPDGVVNLVAGGRGAGEALVDGDVNGIAFTGSVGTGRAIHRALAERPEVLLALEMGGNNPLVVADVDDVEAAVNIIVRSAFITSGQRCTCARRLYLPAGPAGDAILDSLVQTTERLRVAAPDADPEPFLGPVVTVAAADRVRSHVESLVHDGATQLTESNPEFDGTAFVRPTIVDATGVEVADDEVFGPVLTVHSYSDIDEAFAAAADTAYGLAAGLISDEPEHFKSFQSVMKAGVINFNCPTTGASGKLPFGGVGASGNHRPAGFAAATFCAYPVATMQYDAASDAVAPIRGLEQKSRHD